MTEDFTKLTVPALKVLCKEKRISGYSKLGKQALVEKLNAFVNASTATPQVLPPAQISLVENSSPLTLSLRDNSSIALPASDPSQKRKTGDHELEPSTSSSKRHKKNRNVVFEDPHAPAIVEVQATLQDSLSALENAPDDGGTENDSSYSDANIRVLVDKSPAVQEAFTRTAIERVPYPRVAPRQDKALAELHGTPTSQTLLFSRPSTNILDNVIDESKKRLLPVSKPFRPVFPKKMTPKPLVPSVIHAQTPKHCIPLFHFDFPISGLEPAPQGISMPPRLSQRGRTSQLASILMRLSNSERKHCQFVSKAWRYAIYLSAQRILQRYFPGPRLDAYLGSLQSSLSQLDLWPYLRYREKERDSRLDAYVNSFLYPLVGPHPISSALWASPRHERQIVIALRFLLARTWLAVNISDQRVVKWTKSTIVDAIPASSGLASEDIWKITVESSANLPHYGSGTPPASSSIETFWVLAETGEAIGEGDTTSGSSTKSSVTIRADWADFLNSCLTPAPKPIIDCVRWTNAEEYIHGISRHWLKKSEALGLISGEAMDTQHAERVVARRYILASVVGNSLSGRYQSATEMAQLFNGVLNCDLAPKRKTAANLFVPEHHYVESVHFTTSHGEPLHPAVAVIMTPTREYYILRDTGSEIGCEETGIYDVWVDAIGCSKGGMCLG